MGTNDTPHEQVTLTGGRGGNFNRSVTVPAVAGGQGASYASPNWNYHVIEPSNYT